MWQGSHEQPKVGVHAVLELVDDGFHFVHEAQAQLAVLQPREMTAGAGSFYLLQRIQCSRWVGTSTEEEHNGSIGRHGIVDRFNGIRYGLDICAGPISLVFLKSSLHLRMLRSTRMQRTNSSFKNGLMSGWCSGSLSSYHLFHTWPNWQSCPRRGWRRTCCFALAEQH